jgi:hypothetical protein
MMKATYAAWKKNVERQKTVLGQFETRLTTYVAEASKRRYVASLLARAFLTEHESYRRVTKLVTHVLAKREDKVIDSEDREVLREYDELFARLFGILDAFYRELEVLTHNDSEDREAVLEAHLVRLKKLEDSGIP